jgi:hypothetical protein
VTAQPSPHERLDAWRSALGLAHETAFTVHLDLVVDERDSDRSRALLAESAKIAVVEVGVLVAEAQRLANRWDEASVLEPAHASDALDAFDRELRRVEPTLRELVSRQRAVVRKLLVLGAG